MNIKIMIATPAYSGEVNIPYLMSFAETTHELKIRGIQVVPLVITSSSLLVSERNRIIEAFWKSDCTHLLCIDADLGWPWQAVLAMLDQNKDFISGVYPSRKPDENAFIFRPALNDDGSIVQENHLLKMEYVPAGFMLISRNCISTMREKLPHLYYCPKDPESLHGSAYAFFNTEIYEGEFWGEDYVFCRNARQAGIDIWVDPLIQFNHAGKIGMLIEALTNDKEKALRK